MNIIGFAITDACLFMTLGLVNPTLDQSVNDSSKSILIITTTCTITTFMPHLILAITHWRINIITAFFWFDTLLRQRTSYVTFKLDQKSRKGKYLINFRLNELNYLTLFTRATRFLHTFSVITFGFNVP